jgi:2-polyprenyl-6-methoxyphenol hydroxylase-like FAD-dependent oxidoreductase
VLIESGRKLTAGSVRRQDGKVISRAEGSLLIGADGIRSAVRRQMLGDGAAVPGSMTRAQLVRSLTFDV